jgi:DNA end-binding protein Ku
MRSIWSGSINFGLVNIPVKLYSAVQPKEGLDLDMLHAEDHSPIKYARICREDGEEVPWDEIVKGYEYRDGDYVVLSKKDLEAADPEKTHSLDIQQFVEEDEIDSRYFEKPYYLEPGKGADKAYALLRQALQQSGRLALVKYVLRDREHIGVLKPFGRAIMLLQMRYQTDLREAGNLKFPTDKGVSKAELEMAEALVKQQTKPFAAEDFHDTYLEEVEEMIKEKVKGKKPASHHKAPASAKSQDLMSALKASLEGTKSGK